MRIPSKEKGMSLINLKDKVSESRKDRVEKSIRRDLEGNICNRKLF